jgi:endonuclease YncB( thermonuclease family)
MRTALIATTLLAAACASATAVHADPVKSIDWTDADSGYADGVAFRLADVDAPETGGVGSVNGAKCEAERALGFKAKDFVLSATKGRALTITYNGEVDRWDRRIAVVTVDGKDLGSMGLAAGHFRPYVFQGPRAKMPKPKWCP